MKRIDIDSNDRDTLKYLLDMDPLDRNKYLKVLINFLNNVEGQMVLNLDGNWGTGKTILLKELEYINQEDFEFPQRMTETSKINIVKDFKEKYEVFYFNVWENDLYGSPLESMIFQLLIKLEEVDKDESIVRNNLQKINSLLKTGGLLVGNLILKGISGGGIELSDITPEKNDITEIITSTDEKKRAITELFGILSTSLSKQLLIVVDELDRCKPSYAVEFLEVVKHFFTSENIVFLFASNKNELTNTIKLAYGQNFDGYKYFNRFFDFEFSLPKIDIKRYLQYKFSDDINLSYYYGQVIIEVCFYFNFSMRDIDRYVSLCSNLKNFWLNSNNRYYSNNFIEIVMIPYAIGLKVHSGEAFNDFINGEGLANLIDFCELNDLAKQELFSKGNSIGLDQKETFHFTEEVTRIYNYITDNKESPSNSEVEFFVIKNMLEILTMMSDASSFI